MTGNDIMDAIAEAVINEATNVREPAYAFTEEDARQAFAEWGANCGPTALATCLQMTLEEIRPKLRGCDFEAKRYMSPSMMAQAIRDCGFRVVSGVPKDALPFLGLARVQWHGPWTAAGANPRWAYRYTHWISSVRWNCDWWVFDVNGGWKNFESWQREIVPLILESIPRSDGRWTITHHWEVRKSS